MVDFPDVLVTVEPEQDPQHPASTPIVTVAGVQLFTIGEVVIVGGGEQALLTVTVTLPITRFGPVGI